MAQNAIEGQTPFLFFTGRPENKNLPIISFTPGLILSHLIISFDKRPNAISFLHPEARKQKPSHHIIDSMSYFFCIISYCLISYQLNTMYHVIPQNVINGRMLFLFFTRRPENKNLPIISFTPSLILSHQVI